MNQPIYLGLDFPTWEVTENFLMTHQLQGVPVKVGMELFYREGPSIIEKLKQNNHPIFLDLKLHDIPTTVKRAMHNIASLEVDLVNVHALGGSQMIEYAKEGLLSTNSSKQTKLIAVTILTSMEQTMMNHDLNIQGDLQEQIGRLAYLSKRHGADGVVCSAHESTFIKEKCGEDFLTITPGIRLENSSKDDQKRIATPKVAREQKADYLVIGRSITRAKNPKTAYQQAMKELKTI
ncbi:MULTISPECIES: orotidine-5'-phosphate decarboxylase [Allobacillus]|uniref:Orotidine 5'-phosphate decarboxylase n=1 Tax=Allobacillus salarius TaxID=1955272 RepID=A0A556PA57_9BACI|nr:orotidine-5'-phosphate decarboxylase [Allobacillus salarius]TSJ61255.1 orotidine-5'-phosphate decarboxylase [Allobacillus salarius]